MNKCTQGPESCLADMASPVEDDAQSTTESERMSTSVASSTASESLFR